MPGIMTYLESADSTRMTYDDLGHNDENAKINANKAEIQLFLEMVAALAMGRQIVVPQTFAFDSYIFQRAAARVWKAYDQADVSAEPPIRLHLFDASTFEESVSKNISRTKGGRGGFRSSLFPELNSNLKKWNLDPTDGSNGILRALPDDDPRKDVFFQTVTRFKYATPNPFARPPRYGTLSEQLKKTIHSRALANDPVLRSILENACEVLNLSQYHLTARSDLRSTEAWPGGHGGQSAKDLIGDEALAILTEVVDTLYNKTVAWTTGARYQLYTTRLAQIDDTLHRTGRAQSAAVENGDSASTDNGTSFDLQIESSRPLPPKELDKFLSDINSNRELLTGLACLFRARADSTSEFQDSLRSVACATDPALHAKRLRQHIHVVARTLGHGYEPMPSGLKSAGISLGLAVAGTAGGLAWNPPADFLGAVVLGTMAVGGPAASIQAPLRTFNERQKNTRRAERALGSILRANT